MQKRIIFLDVSGSVCFNEFWETAKTILKASLTKDKNLDTYVCIFADAVKLLNEKELQQLLDTSDLASFSSNELNGFHAGTSSELKKVLEFFPLDFVKDAKIEIISDFIFSEADAEEAKSKMQATWERDGLDRVTFYQLDYDLVKLLTTAKQELETEKKEEKTPEKIFEPTRKGK